MTNEQMKAARKLELALRACMDARLTVLAFTDMGVFAVPQDTDRDEWDLAENSGNPVYSDFLRRVGRQVDPLGLVFDGGAGV